VEIQTYYRLANGTVMTKYGTGTLVGPHDVLTSAHIVDIGGTTAQINGASVFIPTSVNGVLNPFQVLVFPGMNGLLARPFGYAKMTYAHIPQQYYKNDTNFDDDSQEWDIAMLDLDRNIGSPQFANWVPFGWVSDSLLDNIVATQDPIEVPGYPGANPVEPGADRFHPFVDTGPVQVDRTTPQFVSPYQWITYAKNQIYTAPGDSGAPLIDNDPEWVQPTILGVVKGSYPATDGTAMGRAVRITRDKYDWLVGVMRNNSTPVDRPDLMDRDTWFNTRNSSFSVYGAASPGSKIQVNASIWNGGTAKAGTFIVSFYLSRTPTITSNAIRLPGSVTVNSLAPFQSTAVIWKGKLPRQLAKGSYYVGWIIDPNNRVHDYDNLLNGPLGTPSVTGYVRTRLLNVR
jgi:V8-like Glu-specific endopeptidase